ncbi:hypothetical protein FDI40_gp524 [Agrobacterium phage Atu_ph07]|uniref:Uncharacterized protein n=1 Tax=Agrobacterium phage Atu_ph07 TaxID=2024264 RepID=A0A2L0V0H7_9CAUD|nr:hypothetical protein FDI40_gp524 [Agrobacterium phage Atu_ph07]AUZ95283.1 hypothetical protein [Agrobacterium phage Atu_ph07]
MSDIFEHRKIVNDNLDEIASISNLLHEVGMTKLAKRLDVVIGNINTSVISVVESHMTKLDEMVSQANQNTKNILEALVTGVDLGRRESLD